MTNQEQEIATLPTYVKSRLLQHQIDAVAHYASQLGYVERQEYFKRIIDEADISPVEGDSHD